MKISVWASTKPGFTLGNEEALLFAGHAAGVCYMPEDFAAILAEPTQKTKNRAAGTLASGHHSVFDHASFTLRLEGIPKILAMILNNENEYATSEKSARYTQMQPSPSEQVLYDKWLVIFEGLIAGEYPHLTEKEAHKLAQENARYLISVFTPTVMVHTTTRRQWNYVIHWCERFVKAEPTNEFFVALRPFVQEFIDKMSFLRVGGLNDEIKNNDLSLFDSRSHRQECFGEVYCTTYLGSFAQLAQAQRHRTLDYKMRLLGVPSFYVPPIIADDEFLTSQWLTDIESVARFFPQGMMISITERGTYENFILKTKERLCSPVQLEISRQTWVTMQQFLKSVELSGDLELYRILLRYNSSARCGAGYKCPKPCRWGTKQLDRRV